MGATAFVGQAWRFGQAVRDLRRNPVSLEDAQRSIAEERRSRAPTLLSNLDQMVWPYPSSPTRRLLECAGIERGDVERLVASQGVEASLETLCGQGVYVAYEEALGIIPARRGSTTLKFEPRDFFNPLARSDFMVGSSGTRSTGTAAPSSFAYVRRQARTMALGLASWGLSGAPTAMWMPVFPGGGVGPMLKLTGAGNPPQMWFSQIDLSLAGVTRHKRLANRLLQVAGRLPGSGLPPLHHAPATNPDPVIAWATAALAAEGRAYLFGYASSCVRMAQIAKERGVSLKGLVMALGGEPATPAKTAAIRASGASPLNYYGFQPEGTVGMACPSSPDEEIHLWDHEHVVVGRRRATDHGETVGALCWTTLARDAPRALLNVENDDFGEILRYGGGCDCLVVRLGMTTRLRGIRGVSKVVAGGTTLAGELLTQLTEVILPSRFGGGPGDYQFVEDDSEGPTTISLRIDPRVNGVTEAAVQSAIRAALAGSDAGLMAAGVWETPPGVVRASPLPAPSGKILAFERIRAPRRSQNGS